MRVSEIFYSIQGEGKLSGMPSAFIRTTGCNLRCVWCDTPYTSWEAEAGESLGVDAIVTRVRAFPTRHVVLTGGEPMLEADVTALTRRLRDESRHVTIETAATVWRDVACDLASVSPKLANSTPWDRSGGRFAAAHEKARIDIEVIRRFLAMPDYQIKFVVEAPNDVVEIDALLGRIGAVEPSNVLLMPQGVTPQALADKKSWLAELCKSRGFRYCPRLQIELFGHRRGT